MGEGATTVKRDFSKPRSLAYGPLRRSEPRALPILSASGALSVLGVRAILGSHAESPPGSPVGATRHFVGA